MADLPEHLDPARHRDVSARAELTARRTLLVVLTAIAGLALVGLFGQSPSSSTASGESAELEVSAPPRVRGGLFFQGRFTIDARGAVGDATLVFDSGWLENMHVNTIEPAPVEEESRDGRLALAFGPLAAGDRLVVYMQFQVNPTNVGRRSADVELYDGTTILLVTHSIAEAVFLGTRVELMSPRPGRLVRSFEVDLPAERNYAEVMTDPRFGALTTQIRGLLGAAQ